MTVPVTEVRLGSGRVYLRDLCGADERALGGTSTPAALALLDRLLVAGVGARLGPGEAAALTASERDRLLAAVYERAFGARVGGSAPCAACGELYDLDFRLPDLVEAVYAQGTALEVRVPSGDRYRVPTGADELAVADLPAEVAPEALRARCLLEGAGSDTLEAVAVAFEAAAPVLDMELGAACPACGAANALPFSMQRWALSAFERERPRLLDEVHSLARAYGWGLQEILSLTRQERRAFVSLLDRPSAEWRGR